MSLPTALILGLVLGLVYVAYARRRGRAELVALAVGLVGAALIYLVFAALGGASLAWLAVEVVGIGIYGALAWLGLRRSPLWLAAGWAAHPLWDVFGHLLGGGAAFTPRWYALACISFDLVVGAYVLFTRVGQGRRR